MKQLTVEVKLENCEEATAQLLSILRGSVFGVKGLDGTGSQSSRKIQNLRLYDGPSIPGFDPATGYIFKNGEMSILLSSGKKFYWDLRVEEVAITYFESGVITIERKHISKGSRTVVIYFE